MGDTNIYNKVLWLKSLRKSRFTDEKKISIKDPLCPGVIMSVNILYACVHTRANIPTCWSRGSVKSRSGVKIIIAVVFVTTRNVSKKNVQPGEIYSEKFISSLNARGCCVLLHGTREVAVHGEQREMVICGVI